MFRHSFFKVIFLASIVLVTVISSATATQYSESVVKIFVASNSLDYYRPWQSKGIQASGGSGAIISGNKILTNAHVVADQTFIQVKKSSDPKKYTATLEAIGHDCDLAILTVDNPEFFKNTTPINIGNLPKLQDSVIVIGFPQGGDKLSITEGVVSRIEVTSYSQSSRKLLTVQVDAAINSGNSGGPVLMDGKLVGIAMQVLNSGQGIGYMVPAPIINHFLDDLKDGSYEGFPLLGIDYNNTENTTLRKFYQIDTDEGGILITRVLPFSPAENNLQEGDILFAIDGIKVGEDGTFVFRDDERLNLPYLITKKQIGESINLKIKRNGVLHNIDVKLQDFSPLVPYPYGFEKPPYYIYGGLVFSVLSTDLVTSWGQKWWEKAPLDFNYYLMGFGRLNYEHRKEMIVLLNVLSDDINAGYHNYGNDIVESVNGEKVNSFKEFTVLLNKIKDEQEYTIIKTKRNIEIILENKDMDAKNSSIIKRNSIPRQYSDDVAQWLESE